ncbi:Hypp372 [Branchiostoma lanceolatum]|uniref:Hypp372 protein n=1 Tax=Branchiostoma lanceolatum TaxID=7740 RepID=A0A8J9VD05_BRALA|nr:Hypp372 [Branchiostoma lanceolatum]
MKHAAADDTTCRLAVSNGTVSSVQKNVTPTKTVPTTSHGRQKNTSVTSTGAPQSNVPGFSVTNFWISIIISSIVAGSAIMICAIATFTYQKRRRQNQNRGGIRANLTVQSQIAGALQSNPMYNGNVNQQGTPQTTSMQEFCQTNNDAKYNQINEEEVYTASGHHYLNEIKDEDTSGGNAQVLDASKTDGTSNTYNQINEDEVYDPSHHDYCEIKDDDANASSRIDEEDQQSGENNVPKQVTQSRNKEDNDDDSVTFYAAAAEVRLSAVSNVGGNTSLYQSDRKATAPEDCRLENLSVTRTVDEELTAYNMAGLATMEDAVEEFRAQSS